MKTAHNECFAYIRVSTIKQGEGVSLEAQKEAIQGFADRSGLTITQWFEEKETAAKSGRPVFSTMLKQLHKGLAGGVIIHKIDRSARNIADWAKIGELSDSGIDVHFAAESLDFRSRGGRLTADIQAVIAADYIRNLREETIKGINGRLKQGLYPFKAPIGYLDNGGGKVKTIDPVRGPLVRKLFELYGTGEFSIRMLVEKMKQCGLSTDTGGAVTKTGIERILRNPFYIGLIYLNSRNETFKGAHEPLISVNLFETAQDLKSGRHIKRKTRHKFTYRGLFRCADCRRSMIPERQKGHVYYRCQTPACPTKTIRESEIEQQLFSKMTALHFTSEAIEELGKAMRQWVRCKMRTATRDSTGMELAQIASRKDKLTDALLDELIDKATYQERLNRLLLQECQIAERKRKQVSPIRNQRNTEKFLELLKSLCLTHSLAEPDEKRSFVKTVFSNRFVNGKNLELEPRNWVLQTHNLLCGLVGAPDRTNPRSGTELSDQITETVQNLFDCLEL
ncbi:recombinase family protein [Hoeflea sp. AS60]|uniref:recombinase family protein n=1 Tax=Hoeflea sp. AS60 TaxID=3135780 RepID=UPI0031726150